MKFPFDLNVSLVFRLLLPGFILAIALLPAASTVAQTLVLKPPLEVALPVASLLLGWIVVLMDDHIYMLLEGRRYWPRILADSRQKHHEQRLKRMLVKVQALESKGADATEWELRTLDFPLNKRGHRQAVLPTRLGNLLKAIETYPTIYYGLDGVFFWSRIWLITDKDTRTEIDQAQAVADSALYVSVACAISGIIGLVYLGMSFPRLAEYPAVTIIGAPNKLALACLAAFLFVAARAAYCMSLSKQRRYGDLYQALFDHGADRLTFIKRICKLAEQKGADDPGTDKREQGSTAWRMLHWNKVRVGGTNQDAQWPELD